MLYAYEILSGWKLTGTISIFNSLNSKMASLYNLGKQKKKKHQQDNLLLIYSHS